MRNRLCAVAMILVAIVGPVAAVPVFEDEKLARGFAARLGKLADEGSALAAEKVTEQATAAAGRRVPLPAVATPCALVPEKTLYEAVVPAVVAVGTVFKCDKCNDWHLGQTATGWLLSPDGLVVTNHHVLVRPEGNRYGVMTSDGEVYAVTGVESADAAGDAAVIRIDTRGRQLPFLPLGAAPDCGSAVTVISHPTGRFFSLTTGVVSRYHRLRYAGHPDPAIYPGADQPATWMTITADFAVGSSGGPVFNAAGEVVGMASRTSAVRPPPAVKPQPGVAPPPPVEQMIFRECVSAQTLQSLVARAAQP